MPLTRANVDSAAQSAEAAARLAEQADELTRTVGSLQDLVHGRRGAVARCIARADDERRPRRSETRSR